jgi:ATP-dependent Clp protease ATP-binding subunit ClpA
MGARPLRRIIQQKVEDPLSDALLSGTFCEGNTILGEVSEGDVVLKCAPVVEEKTPEPVV